MHVQKNGSARFFTLLASPSSAPKYLFSYPSSCAIGFRRILTWTYCTRYFFYGLPGTYSLIATYPPPKRTFLLRCFIVFPHTNCATSTTFLDYFCQSSELSALVSPPLLHVLSTFLIQRQINLIVNSFLGRVASIAAHVTTAIKKWRRSPKLPINTY